MDDATPEQWRPVIGWEGWYEVSDHGRIRRVGGGRGAKVGRIIAHWPTEEGYHRVRLTRDDCPKWFLVHRLVLEAFVGPCPEGLVCNHWDGDKDNNRPANLEWTTQRENNDHAFRTGLRRMPAGEKNAAAKITPEVVAEIRRLAGIEVHRVTAGRYGISQTQVSRIRRGESWRGVP